MDLSLANYENIALAGGALFGVMGLTVYLFNRTSIVSQILLSIAFVFLGSFGAKWGSFTLFIVATVVCGAIFSLVMYLSEKLDNVWLTRLAMILFAVTMYSAGGFAFCVLKLNMIREN